MRTKEQRMTAFARISVKDAVDTLDLLNIREFATVYPDMAFEDALNETISALGDRIVHKPKEYGLKRAEVKAMMKEAKVLCEQEKHHKVEKAKELEHGEQPKNN